VPSQKDQGLQGAVRRMPVSVTGIETGIRGNVKRELQEGLS